MSNQEFESYVALIGKLLQLTRQQREQIGGELQDHLQMRVADLMSDGIAKHDAVAKALEEFGDAAVMAKNFQTVLNLKRRRWMMRFATISMAGAFMAAVLTMALWPDNARFGSPSFSRAQEADSAGKAESDELPLVNLRLSDATQRDLRTEEALKQVVDLSFEETPFSEIMSQLANMTDVNFLLDVSAKDDSLTEDEPLTFNIRKLPLNKSLELMLVEKNATYVIDEGVVVVVSRDIAGDAAYMRLKMFDCRELVKVLPESYPTYKDYSGGGSGGGLFCVPTARDGEGGELEFSQSSSPVQKPGPSNSGNTTANSRSKPVASREATLLNLVYSMVDPESWEHTAGMSTAQVVNGILVVRQMETSFRKIENLLDDLSVNVLAGPGGGEVSARNPLKTKQVPSNRVFATTAESNGRTDNPLGTARSTKSTKGAFSSDESKAIDDPFGR